MRVRFIQSAVVVTTLSLAGAASAHFDLKAPLPSTTSTNGGKGAAPCGPDASSAVITPVMGGSQIAVTVNETVYHPGHYRIALSINSRDEIDPSKPGGLQEPVVKNMQGMPIMTGNSVSADIQNPPVFPVLADGIFAHTAESPTDFTQMITLPNVNCDKCTLQVIEFMADHSPPYFYRHC
ncbi:MAG TPA: SCE4755 family polysaccharide monooxygenase-like protein, partial [Polyangiaceae bacterium]